MASRNYLINSEDLSLTDKKEYKLAALAAGIERCALKNVGSPNADIPGLEAIPTSQKDQRVRHIRNYIVGGNWPRSLDQRELAPGPAAVRTDFVAPTVLAEALTAPLAAVNTWYSCFQAVAAPQLLVGKLLVFYGVCVTPPLAVSYLQFLRGTNVQALFDLQTQNTRLAFDAFFSEPVVFDPQDIFAAQVLCSFVTGVAALVHLHNFLFEKAGDVIA